MRYAFDIAFFIIVLILLLNVIFGIIIDKFGALRDQHAKNLQSANSYCFICSLSKQQLDTEYLREHGISKGFQHHIRTEHNMWDYMRFMLYLQHKDRTEFTGAESYVFKMVEEGNLEWIPFNKTLLLEHTHTATASIQEQLQETMQRLNGMERSMRQVKAAVEQIGGSSEYAKPM
jgi:5-bromo-4-chloroindolyl phosphate hydrolysis protein